MNYKQPFKTQNLVSLGLPTKFLTNILTSMSKACILQSLNAIIDNQFTKRQDARSHARTGKSISAA